jgi:hypothetical protein
VLLSFVVSAEICVSINLDFGGEGEKRREGERENL